MSFLAPLFLAGLAALAVPIILHLVQKEKKDPVTFPSLMFLSKVPYKTTRRRRLRDLLLLALRAAAIVLVVGAFARPFLDRDGAAALDPGAAREVVVLLDRSYSMAYGNRWDRAVNAAGEVVDGLRSGDVASLILYDAAAAAPVRSSADPAEMRAALTAARPGDGATRYAPALKLARTVLETSQKPRREVVIIGDFQRAGWQDEPGLRLPPGTEVSAVPITDDEVNNAAVAGVQLRREPVGDRERVTINARVVARGDAGTIPVVLELDGREAQRRDADVSSGAATVTFAPITAAATPQRVVVRVAGDALANDDAFRFVLSPGQAVRVLVANAPGASSLYIERALDVGEAPPFRVETIPSSALTASAIEDRDVIIVNGTAPAASDALRTFLENGGGLVLAAGERSTGDGSIGPIWGQVVDRGAGGGIGWLDGAHPVFELFRGPRSGDPASARFFRYRPLQPADGDRVLARFDDGAAALVERRVGEGRVLSWASSLDSYWSDFPLQPVFLPWLHRMVLHAAAWEEQPGWSIVGDVVQGVGSRESAVEGLIATSPSGRRVEIPSSGLIQVDEAGFWVVRVGEEERPVAVNVDLAESELTALDPATVVAAAEPQSGSAESLAEAQTVAPEERERRQSLWWWLLLAAFALFAAETALANRTGRTRTRQAQA